MNTAAPATPQTEAIAAMDQAVDRLASTEADHLSKFDTAVAEIDTAERIFDMVLNACRREFAQRFAGSPGDLAWGVEMFGLLEKCVLEEPGLLGAVGNVVFAAAESLSALSDSPAQGMTDAGDSLGNRSET